MQTRAKFPTNVWVCSCVTIFNSNLLWFFHVKSFKNNFKKWFPVLFPYSFLVQFPRIFCISFYIRVIICTNDLRERVTSSICKMANLLLRNTFSHLRAKKRRNKYAEKLFVFYSILYLHNLLTSWTAAPTRTKKRIIMVRESRDVTSNQIECSQKQNK